MSLCYRDLGFREFDASQSGICQSPRPFPVDGCESAEFLNPMSKETQGKDSRPLRDSGLRRCRESRLLGCSPGAYPLSFAPYHAAMLAKRLSDLGR